MNLSRATIFGLTLATSLAGLYACSAAGPDGASQSDEATGSLSAALTSVGPDGASYALPAGTVLVVSSTATDAGGVPTSAVLAFNSVTGTQTFNLPAGTYTGTFSNAPADGGLWSLTRIGDGGANAVPARLTDPQPFTFTITPGQSTALTFHFTVLGIGPVTFSNGSLSTGVQVSSGTTSPGHITITGQFTVGIAAQNQLEVPSLTNALNYSGTPAFQLTEQLTLTSPFQANADYVCANVAASIAVVPSADAGAGAANVAAFYDEGNNGAGTICIGDAAQNAITIQINRFGGATTPVIFNALNGPDAGAPDGGAGVSGEFVTSVFFPQMTPPLYNGTTLTFPTVIQGGGVQQSFVLGSEITGVFGGSPTLTMQFSP